MCVQFIIVQKYDVRSDSTLIQVGRFGPTSDRLFNAKLIVTVQ